MKKLFLMSCITFSVILSTVGHAHHSFAIYELENKTELKGVLTKLTMRAPHIIYTVASEDEDGNIVEWTIETMNPSRWRTFDFPEPDAIAEIGEEISILGWKARAGTPEMALGSIVTAEGETEIRDEIRQGSGGGTNGMGGGMGG